MKLLGLGLLLGVLLAAPAAAAQGARLLGSGAFHDTGGGTAFASEAQLSLLFTTVGVFGAAGPGFRFEIHRSNPTVIVGRTEVLDERDGPAFAAAVALLTNGKHGYVTRQVELVGAGGLSAATIEDAFFEFSGLACPNGIDFGRARIQRIELRIDGVFFGVGPFGQSTLEWSGVVSVFGVDTTCAASALENGRGARLPEPRSRADTPLRRSSDARRIDDDALRN